jgi:hypothetical protein
VAIAGTPKPAHKKVLSSIESAYSDSLSAASVKFQSAMSFTASITSLWAKPTQGTFESISSVASVRLQEGLSQASAQYVFPIALVRFKWALLFSIPGNPWCLGRQRARLDEVAASCDDAGSHVLRDQGACRLTFFLILTCLRYAPSTA